MLHNPMNLKILVHQPNLQFMTYPHQKQRAKILPQKIKKEKMSKRWKSLSHAHAPGIQKSPPYNTDINITPAKMDNPTKQQKPKPKKPR